MNTPELCSDWDTLFNNKYSIVDKNLSYIDIGNRAESYGQYLRLSYDRFLRSILSSVLQIEKSSASAPGVAHKFILDRFKDKKQPLKEKLVIDFIENLLYTGDYYLRDFDYIYQSFLDFYGMSSTEGNKFRFGVEEKRNICVDRQKIKDYCNHIGAGLSNEWIDTHLKKEVLEIDVRFDSIIKAIINKQFASKDLKLYDVTRRDVSKYRVDMQQDFVNLIRGKILDPVDITKILNKEKDFLPNVFYYNIFKNIDDIYKQNAHIDRDQGVEILKNKVHIPIINNTNTIIQTDEITMYEFLSNLFYFLLGESITHPEQQFGVDMKVSTFTRVIGVPLFKKYIETPKHERSQELMYSYTKDLTERYNLTQLYYQNKGTRYAPGHRKYKPKQYSIDHIHFDGIQPTDYTWDSCRNKILDILFPDEETLQSFGLTKELYITLRG